jgi:tRNA(fMet)-specific endonuclease VapC
MPVRYLLDTNIVSYAINNRYPRVREKMQRVPFHDMAVSVITEAELRYGLARLSNASRLRFAVEDFLEHAEILPWDSLVAKRYAALRAGLELEGYPLGAMDLMIAAHASAVEATLVTHDRVFRRVKGLKQVDWTQ